MFEVSPQQLPAYVIYDLKSAFLRFIYKNVISKIIAELNTTYYHYVLKSVYIFHLQFSD